MYFYLERGGGHLVSPKLLLFPFSVKHSISSLGFISNSTNKLNKVALSQCLQGVAHRGVVSAFPGIRTGF